MSGKKKGIKSKPRKKAGVLAGHKQVGKKFIPLLMQFGGLSEARWVQRLLPEFLWLALLHERLGYSVGVEIARNACAVARGIDGIQARWFAALSTFRAIPNSKRSEFVAQLRSQTLLDDLEHGLAPLHQFYPDHPLAFTSVSGRNDESLDDFKAIVAELYSRTTTTAVRAQATAFYLGVECGQHHPLPAMVREFPEIQQYPDTEKSRELAGRVRASLNAVTIMLKVDPWPNQFWNRGLAIDSCELRKDPVD